MGHKRIPAMLLQPEKGETKEAFKARVRAKLEGSGAIEKAPPTPEGEEGHEGSHEH